jgi:hypothetical protein
MFGDFTSGENTEKIPLLLTTIANHEVVDTGILSKNGCRIYRW